MIKRDDNITTQITKIAEKWKYLEQLSRRPDRKEESLKREAAFNDQMKLPFNILKRDGEQILCQAGIKCWEEDMTHLRNQLDPRQIGFDIRQKKKDERAIHEKMLKDKKKKIIMRRRKKKRLRKKQKKMQ